MHKRVLITGNQGFIGSYLKNSLQDSYEIVGFNRAMGSDITDYASLKKPEKEIEVIIHTAAIASNDYETSFNSNVIGTLNICRYAKEHGIKRIILLSSIFALDAEDNEYFNSYGQTKKLSEEVALSYCQEHEIKLCILRLAQVYDDARIAIKGQAMLYYFVDTIKNEGKITLFGNKNPLRNYIHIDYLCDVVGEVLTQKQTGTWNIIEEQSHTIAEIAYMIFALLEKKPDINRLIQKPAIASVHIPRTDIYHSNTISPICLFEGLKRILNYEH